MFVCRSACSSCGCEEAFPRARASADLAPLLQRQCRGAPEDVGPDADVLKPVPGGGALQGRRRLPEAAAEAEGTPRRALLRAAAEEERRRHDEEAERRVQERQRRREEAQRRAEEEERRRRGEEAERKAQEEERRRRDEEAERKAQEERRRREEAEQEVAAAAAPPSPGAASLEERQRLDLEAARAGEVIFTITCCDAADAGFGIRSILGVGDRIDHVSPGGPAEAAGMGPEHVGWRVARVNGRAAAPETLSDRLWAATAPGRTFSIGVLQEDEPPAPHDVAVPPLPPPGEPPEGEAHDALPTSTLHGASPLSRGLVNEGVAAMREGRQPPLETLHEGARESPAAAGAAEVSRRFRFVLAGRGARAVASCLSQSRASRRLRPQPAEGGADAGERQGAGLCFYCLLGARSQLAEISFTIVEGFSDPLPTIQTPESAKGTCVVLLHHRAAAASLGAGVGGSIGDFDVRVAEANHGMKAMPLFVILAVTESAREVDALSQYLQDWKLHDARPAKLVQAVDDSEASLADAVQSIAEELINDQARCQKIDSFLEEQRFKTGDVNQRKPNRKFSMRYACPLHAAVRANNLEAVEALLESGADPRVEDSEKLTPVALAHLLNRDMSHEGIINALYEGARKQSK